ncbi:4-alpha-glucanotransferase [Clostridium sp. Marseille-P299]|uniref:4-alpha-glucanotransferase n=1 Tax=Clostridium sp. Marseille-P299 TaxID=1805477 RepID=UPI0008316737|nr:4-alpha-glucanotransferase [Clostridium sp. Marseille-P299]
MKKVGVLMPVASLPSNHGIGDFGKYSYDFIDSMKKAGMNIWQILPLNPLGYGNSPYQPYSSYAGDELYINLDRLVEDGLLEEVKPYRKNKKTIDYIHVRNFKNKYLKKAFRNFKPNKAYKAFIQQEWVYEYAVYLTLKKQNNLICWNEWPVEQQNWILDRQYDLAPFQEAISYEMFVQYEFYKQWLDLKAYANKNGIEIMGDIPIYVGIDSLDVWSNQKCFLLGADNKPSFVAGVPPDYFSKTGQRWGNPIYDWDYIEKTNFKFWIDRLSYCNKMFDIVRIDHFRAFDTYWKIPASCPTAEVGEWVEAPGYALFDEVFKQIKDINIIVEDLGDLRPEVLQLRDHYDFKGMRIVQFNFNPDEEENSVYDHVENLVLYTGTHDNQTMRGWYKDQPAKIKKRVRKNLKRYECLEGPISWKFVEFTYKQNSYMSIVPMQDIINLGDEGRINTPGTLGSPNWEWKMNDLKPFVERVDALRKILRK